MNTKSHERLSKGLQLVVVACLMVCTAGVCMADEKKNMT